MSFALPISLGSDEAMNRKQKRGGGFWFFASFTSKEGKGGKKPIPPKTGIKKALISSFKRSQATGRERGGGEKFSNFSPRREERKKKGGGGRRPPFRNSRGVFPHPFSMNPGKEAEEKKRRRRKIYLILHGFPPRRGGERKRSRPH